MRLERLRRAATLAEPGEGGGGCEPEPRPAKDSPISRCSAARSRVRNGSSASSPPPVALLAQPNVASYPAFDRSGRAAAAALAGEAEATFAGEGMRERPSALASEHFQREVCRLPVNTLREPD
eukprot:4277715-Prymnesium_polylepis.2